jgi:hypothetical protein
MSHSRSRSIAVPIAAVGLLVLVAAGLSLKDVLRERYFLSRLESGTEDERKSAAETLGRIGSPRAIPALLGALKREGHEPVQAITSAPAGGQPVTVQLSGQAAGWMQQATRAQRLGLPGPVGPPPPGAVLFLAQTVGGLPIPSAPSASVLEIARRSFRGARPYLEGGLDDGDATVRFAVTCVLRHLDDRPEGVEALLEKASRDRDEGVRSTALEVLESLGRETASASEDVTGGFGSGQVVFSGASGVSIRTVYPCPICGSLHGAGPVRQSRALPPGFAAPGGRRMSQGQWAGR